MRQTHRAKCPLARQNKPAARRAGRLDRRLPSKRPSPWPWRNALARSDALLTTAARWTAPPASVGNWIRPLSSEAGRMLSTMRAVIKARLSVPGRCARATAKGAWRAQRPIYHGAGLGLVLAPAGAWLGGSGARSEAGWSILPRRMAGASGAVQERVGDTASAPGTQRGRLGRPGARAMIASGRRQKGFHVTWGRNRTAETSASFACARVLMVSAFGNFAKGCGLLPPVEVLRFSLAFGLSTSASFSALLHGGKRATPGSRNRGPLAVRRRAGDDTQIEAARLPLC